MLFLAAGQQLYHFPSAGNLGLMGDQPDMDRFGAGGAGGHAPFGLPKGVKPLPYPITMSDTTYMVKSHAVRPPHSKTHGQPTACVQRDCVRTADLR